MSSFPHYKTALSLLILLLSFSVKAQDFLVYDANSNTPIDQVIVYTTDLKESISSNSDGQVDLSIFEEDEILEVYKFGYEKLRISKRSWAKNDYAIYLYPQSMHLDEVIMSVSKWKQYKSQVPQKIQVIDQKAIELQQPQTSADLLQQSGNVYVQKSQLGGGSPMIRGFAANRLLLVVDGVRMNNAIFRGGNLQNVISIDPFIVDKTEVLFGTGSVIYGSDAMGGVINFYTKSNGFSSKRSFKANAHSRFSSANKEWTNHADFSISSSKWSHFSSITQSDFSDLMMGTSGPDDYLNPLYIERIDGVDQVVQNDQPLRQINSGYSMLSAFHKSVYQPSSHWKHEFSWVYSKTSDIPRYDRLIRPGKGADPLRSAQWYYGPQLWNMKHYQLHHLRSNSFYSNALLSIAHQRFGESRHNRDFNSPLLEHTEELVDSWTLNLDYEKSIGESIDLFYGYEFIDNVVDSKGSSENIDNNLRTSAPSRYPDNANWNSSALYLNSTFRASDRLSLMSGFRYNKIKAFAKLDRMEYQFPFDEIDLNTGALTANLGMNWTLKNSQLRLNISSGFRAPNIDDLAKVFDSEPGAVVVPNPDLKPEHARGIDIGFRTRIEDHTDIRISTYYTFMDQVMVRKDYNAFVPKDQTQAQEYLEYQGELSRVQAVQNLAHAKIKGIEFALRCLVSPEFKIIGNYSLSKGEYLDENGVSSAVRHVSPNFGQLQLVYEKGPFVLNFYSLFNSEIPFEKLALSERSKTYLYAKDLEGNPYAPSWQTLNFKSQVQLTHETKFSFAIENITNLRYRPYSSGISAPGINLISSLSHQF